MDVNGATVNAASKLNAKARGNVQEEHINGDIEIIPAQAHIQRAEAAERERNSTAIGRATGWLLGVLGRGLQTASEYIRQPVRTKTGMVLGLLAGAAVAVAFTAAAVLTAGLSVGVTAAVFGGIALAGGAAGAGVGYYVSKKGGIGTIVSGAVGGLYFGGVGVAAGMAGYMGINQIVERSTGRTIDSHLAHGLNFAGRLAEHAGEQIRGGGEIGRATLEEQRVARENYAPTAHREIEANVEDLRLRNGAEAAKRNRLDPNTAISIDADIRMHGVIRAPEVESKGSHVEKLQERKNNGRANNTIVKE